MKPNTPLEWLLQHGHTAEAPTKVPQKFGIWVPVSKSRTGLGLKKQGPRPLTMASQFGQISQDGGEFLPFLVEYRRIVEAPDNGINALRIDALKERYPQYANCTGAKAEEEAESPALGADRWSSESVPRRRLFHARRCLGSAEGLDHQQHDWTRGVVPSRQRQCPRTDRTERRFCSQRP